MFTALLDTSLTSGPLPIVAGILCFAALVAVLLKRHFLRWLPVFAAAAGIGAAFGFLLAWYLGDVQDDFGVTLTLATRGWFSLGTAGIFVAIVSLWRSTARRILPATASIILFAFVAALGINQSVGEFPTVASAIGQDASSRHALVLPAPPANGGTMLTSSRELWKSWKAPLGLPRHGRVGSVVIPATISRFHPRHGIVYLPPAALVPDAPELPVVVFLSGEPGGPTNLIDAGQVPEIMDAYAKSHSGLAPIVVIPDQLGSEYANPMCVNSPLGHVATYLTVDVPKWITTHLRVLPDRKDWTIAGFSEGGTCSIQLGTRYRSIFGSILDISGQVFPRNGSIPATIAKAFGGSVTTFDAASPLGLLAAGAPFDSTLAVFAVGQDDAKYGPQTVTVENAAKAARMKVHEYVSVGTSHDWYTVRNSIRAALPVLYRYWGLTP
jgi:S-formylglutathione hydrolase FrmB